MAIARPHYALFKELRRKNDNFPLRGNILEIGEQNMYGDVKLEELKRDVIEFSKDEDKQNLIKAIDSLIDLFKKNEFQSVHLFQMARIWYKIFFQYSSINSIDLHGTSLSKKLDLNYPHKLNKQFDIIINIGTAEHIFNIYQVFKSIHEWTLPGGTMIHNLPMTGEIDHGFYNFHPTFFYDLSLANRYKISLVVLASSQPSKLISFSSRKEFTDYILKTPPVFASGIFIFLQKPLEETTFEIPRQGYYDDNSENKDLKVAWHKQRNRVHKGEQINTGSQ